MDISRPPSAQDARHAPHGDLPLPGGRGRNSTSPVGSPSVVDFALYIESLHSTLPGRFWSKVDSSRGPDGCWPWQGYRDRQGYGRVNFEGHRAALAYRVAWEDRNGPIPVGLEIDHLCRNPWCVNPAHMEPVTHAENQRRGNGFAGKNARATYCLHGHPFDLFNTRWVGGHRHCRTCDRRIVQAKRKT